MSRDDDMTASRPVARRFRQRVERFLYLGLPFPHEPDQALTRGELAERIGVNPNWVTRNVPAYLFIDNRVHWHRYCRWRMKEQERLANEADGSPAIAPEAVAPQTEADRRSKKIEDTFYGRRNSTRDARK